MTEIPQDVWERADAIHFAATKAETTMEEVNIIASAIMAERAKERERCAAEMDIWFDNFMRASHGEFVTPDAAILALKHKDTADE